MLRAIADCIIHVPGSMVCSADSIIIEIESGVRIRHPNTNRSDGL